MEGSLFPNKAEYTCYNFKNYMFMVDDTMLLSKDIVVSLISSYIESLFSEEDIDLDTELKNASIKYIDWVQDVAVHENLSVLDKNCIIIKKDGNMFKFLKFFEKNKEELISELINRDQE